MILLYPASMLVPEEIEYKELTPQTIAKYYRHRQLYNNALRAIGLLDHKELVEEEVLFKLL